MRKIKFIHEKWLSQPRPKPHFSRSLSNIPSFYTTLSVFTALQLRGRRSMGDRIVCILAHLLLICLEALSAAMCKAFQPLDRKGGKRGAKRYGYPQIRANGEEVSPKMISPQEMHRKMINVPGVVPSCLSLTLLTQWPSRVLLQERVNPDLFLPLHWQADSRVHYRAGRAGLCVRLVFSLTCFLVRQGRAWLGSLLSTNCM